MITLLAFILTLVPAVAVAATDITTLTLSQLQAMHDACQPNRQLVWGLNGPRPLGEYTILQCAQIDAQVQAIISALPNTTTMSPSGPPPPSIQQNTQWLNGMLGIRGIP